MIEQRVTLRYDAQQIPAIIQAVQGDTGRDVIFELADYEIPAGATANYYIDKPDGNAVYNSAEVISSTEILAHLTEQALAEPGRNNGQVRILSDDEVITSFDFVLEVEVFRGLLRLQSETEVNIFDEALHLAAEDAIAEIQAQTPVVTGMQNSIAPSYDNSKTYNVGEYVMFNAQLYRCITAIAEPEVWTAAHWTQLPITDDVKNIMVATNNYIYASRWRNGSMFNPGNSDAISIDYLLDVRAIEYIDITFKMQLPAGYIYGLQYSTFSTHSGTCVDNTGNTIRRNAYITSEFGTFRIYINKNEKGFACALWADDGSGGTTPLRIENIDISDIGIIGGILDDAQKYLFENSMVWRDGSVFNPANAQAISTSNVIDVRETGEVIMYASFPLPDGYIYGFEYSTFSVYNGPTTAASTDTIRRQVYVLSEKGQYPVMLESDEVGFAFAIYAQKADDESDIYPLRISQINMMQIAFMKRVVNNTIDHSNVTGNTIVFNYNARHIITNTAVKPLTLLHFSDIHEDVGALRRIINESENYEIDGMICTGDMVPNNYEQITSWWNPNVMTVIGNHDTASYSGGVYDWTALSMQNRDAYYIAPFESNWGIVHTAGTSYYYKDYAAQKVRLIVLDIMLYNNPGAESDAQDTWLANAMTAAKNAGYHVLIASHSSSGGSTRVDCTFSGLDWETMPTYTDCNLPDSVLDIVSAQIESGCVFIGYICGHFHQDMIWEKRGQYMYQVTCANVVNRNQWKESDQHRSTIEDAYNLFSVDTVHGLVKIVRAGGANCDMYMRNRKMICIDYINHRIVGQAN